MIYDISPPLTPNAAVFPGDTPLSREVLLDMSRGDSLTLSTIHATSHLGAHADGPNHYGVDAPAIDEVPLDRYIGPCQVIDCGETRGRRVEISDLRAEVSEERVILRTNSWPDPNAFNRDFSGLSVDLVPHLAKQGVRTIGIDTPSVDMSDAKMLVAHHAILEHSIAILEGLVLRDIEPGRYELIALPLRLVGFDASPVRAILRTFD